MKIRITSHAYRAIRARMGARKAEADRIARHAFDSAEAVPLEWEVPMPIPRFCYYRHGPFVFIFAPGRSHAFYSYDTRYLVTVVGPFGDGKKWEPGTDS